MNSQALFKCQRSARRGLQKKKHGTQNKNTRNSIDKCCFCSFQTDRTRRQERPFLALIYQLAQREIDQSGACIIVLRYLLEAGKVNCRAQRRRQRQLLRPASQRSLPVATGSRQPYSCCLRHPSCYPSTVCGVLRECITYSPGENFKHCTCSAVGLVH